MAVKHELQRTMPSTEIVFGIFAQVTSLDGYSFYATGLTSSSASHGLHQFNFSGTRSTRVSIGNAANQRCVI